MSVKRHRETALEQHARGCIRCASLNVDLLCEVGLRHAARLACAIVRVRRERETSTPRNIAD